MPSHRRYGTSFMTDHEGAKSYDFVLGANWVNPEDPNVIAENELLGAAAAIEAAARKLAELKPKPRPKVRESYKLQGRLVVTFLLNSLIIHEK